MLSANLIKVFELLNRGVPLNTLLLFVLYRTPEMLTYAIPLALLCATVLVFSKLSADNEIDAMRACGISLWQIISPALLLSIVLSAVCLYLQASVAPRWRYAADQLKRGEGIRNPLVMLEPGTPVEFPGHLVRIGRREGNRLYDVDIYVFDEKDGSLIMDISAANGSLEVDEDARELRFVLKNAQWSSALRDSADTEPDIGDETTASANMARISSDEVELVFDYGTRLDSKRLSRKLKYMDFSMVFARIYCDLPHTDTTRHYVQLHTRMALALSPFAFILIGIPFGIRTRRSETSIGLLLSFGLALGFYVFVILADSLKTRPQMHPEMLVWIPNVTYQLAGLWALSRLAKR
jgi:lipopolysaccharide export LptBFGC system permease protein LptF